MKTPEKVYFHKGFDFNDMRFGSACEPIHRGNHEYIRKDISEAKEKEAYKKGSDDCHKAFVSSGHFTKEQVIELMKRAWRDSSKAEFDRILEGGDEEIAATDFEYWLEQEKPFDSK